MLSYLNAVPLSEIERIEVHQGRTADMDASIEGGYVNIVMKIHQVLLGQFKPHSVLMELKVMTDHYFRES